MADILCDDRTAVLSSAYRFNLLQHVAALLIYVCGITGCAAGYKLPPHLIISQQLIVKDL